MLQAKRVALLIESSRAYARDILRGITRYQREHVPWSIYFEPGGLDDPPPSWLEGWDGDGIIARIDSDMMANTILATGLPAVDVRGAIPDLTLPLVTIDKKPLSQIGCNHLRELGLTSFAYCGTPTGENRNHDQIYQYFAAAVKTEGFDCSVYLSKQPKQKNGPTWEEHQQALASWLAELPKPIGIMTCHDERGLQVLDACRRAEISVPDEIAVVGVDNDPFVCNLSTPPLTSIDVNASRVGFEAAVLLDKLMRNEQPHEQLLLIGPPRGIVNRRSTDMLIFEDKEVEDAVRFIRDSAIHNIGVNDVVRRARRAPSTLDRRFKKLLGHTIKFEITRVRLQQAKKLLGGTELSVERIAEQSGFSERKYFCEVFRKHEGMTATQYRQKFRVD